MKRERLYSEKHTALFPIVHEDTHFICTRGLGDPDMVHVYSNEEEALKYGSYTIKDQGDALYLHCAPENSSSFSRTVKKENIEGEIHEIMRHAVRRDYNFCK
ncbi:hypothetical protein [Bacillus phage BC-T25]|nr:hypothetical protein [Bacillus phage BC-T25]